MKRLLALIAVFVLGSMGVSSAGDLNVTGKVGIGTANPLYDLHISEAGARYLRLEDTSGSGNFIQLRANSANGAYIGSEQNLSFRTGVGLNNLVLIGPTGNVGVGTSSPLSKLDVNIGSTDSANGMVLNSNAIANPYQSGRLFFNNINDAGHAFSIFKKGSGPDSYLEFAAGGTPGTSSGSTVMVVKEAGNVGIGTASPEEKLHVAGNILISNAGNPSLRISASNPLVSFEDPNHVDKRAWLAKIGSRLVVQHRSDSNEFQSEPFSVDIAAPYGTFFMDGSGKIGIGTITPARKVHINDAMRLEPRSTAPSNPALGDIYVDSDTNELCFYDGTSWTGLKAGGACL